MRFVTAHDRASPPRAGLSIVEVLLALVLVSVGILGMAGSSALALRAAGAADQEHRAVRLAALRMARLSAAGCDAARSGIAAEDRASFSERWEVGSVLNGAVTVQLRVAWLQGGVARSLVIESALLC
jgi:Tfp pilus assembly protein PilV